MIKFLFGLSSLIVILSGCSSKNEHRLFNSLPDTYTHIGFNNEITETESLNVLSFEYIYNGGGVGVGDVNHDGLQDLFFAGNMVPGKLYINTGGLQFQDITLESGIATKGWCTGVAMVDINQDGLLDIYISTINPDRLKSSANLLYIHQGYNKDGIPLFKEMAAAVGLADSSYSTQAAFLDYDLDGDLDVYLCTNFLENFNRNTPFGQRHDGTGKSVDKLFRNEGLVRGLPVYTNVSREAGILSEGWGLGIVVNDINQDGYPDVYVANDFMANDHLYINQRDGTFKNEIAHYIKHQEHNGMGVDMADINNDGLNDIVAVDMMPEDNLRQKTMFSNTGYDRFQLNLQRKYQPQYTRNVLQLNNGNNTFSDIGYLAGMYATDWSWSPLLADFDNDGLRDLFITNGFKKDITDLDFVAYSKGANMFGTTGVKMKKTLEAVSALQGVKKNNCMFKNNGDLTFTENALQWGMDTPSYSTGAAYADLDNDGDLDVVVNNINAKAFVYENTSRSDTSLTANNFLSIRLQGQAGNANGLGSKLWVYAQNKMLYAEHQSQRGYQSSVDPIEHFGLGNIQNIDSLKIIWPDGKTEILKNISANKFITLNEERASKVISATLRSAEKYDFAEVHKKYNVMFRHAEDDFVDYKQGQPLLLHKHSQGGPAIATGDIDQDGKEDFIVGGSARHPATIFLQQQNGSFAKDSLESKTEEDMGLLLFDADGDGDLDLYCVSGSSEFGLKSPYYQDRLYKNNGAGKFTLDVNALPVKESSGSCVTASDYDHDGDLDLFVGGRISPTRYPEAPLSYILRNNNGKFENVTTSVCAEMQRIGMVTSALWTDYNNDGWTDLVVVGEWMPITFFQNEKGKYFTKKFAEHTGWWNSISGGDMDNDGDTDYVLGNLGLNSLYKTSEKEPVSLYAKDFDNNGTIDPIVTRYVQGKEYPTHYRETMTEQMTSMKKKLTSYAGYGSMTFSDLITPDQLKDALIFRSTTFSSAYLENQGHGEFKLHPLPLAAQRAPLFGIQVIDIDGDQNLDIAGVGNCYASETLGGYYDAGIGVALYGDGAGNFNPRKSGSAFFVDTDAKAMAIVTGMEGPLLVVTSNQDSLKMFELNHRQQPFMFTPEADDGHAEIVLENGKRQWHEFYYGAGYLSQSTRTQFWYGASEIYVTKFNGAVRKIFPAQNKRSNFRELSEQQGEKRRK